MDNIFRTPRLWSNAELKKLAPLFPGDVVNVSGWNDGDKEGAKYRDYFTASTSYTLTNYKAEARGFQGMPNELFLDLEAELDPELIGRFDVVFNHTVLEHIYQVQKAFSNLCSMSKDVVIVVVPFVQKMHADYGDYWRFTPQTMQRMFEENGMKLQYLSFNSDPFSSVYLFAVGVKDPAKWDEVLPYTYDHVDPVKVVGSENFVGVHSIQNPTPKNLAKYALLTFKRLIGQ